MEPRDLLSKNLDLFVEMKNLAVEQENLVNPEDMERFMDIAKRREHLQRQIMVNDRKYQELTDTGDASSTDPEATRIRKDTIHVVRSIQEIDQKIEDGLAQKKDLFFSEIKQIRKGQRAVRGYVGNPVRTPRFVNRKG